MGAPDLTRNKTRQLTVAGAAGSPAHTRLWLVGEHVAAATLLLMAAAGGLVWAAPDLANGVYLAPHVAGVTHLVTLGWLTLTIFGAMYQFVPVALGAPIRSTRAAHAAFWMLAPGIVAFACGLAGSRTPLLAAGAALVAIGILTAATNMAVTLARSRTRDVTWAAIAVAITFLVGTVVFGLLLADNLRSGAIAAERAHVMSAHLHIAIVGWALIMIVGVSNRMLPMFLLARESDARWSRRAVGFLTAGVPTIAVGLLGGVGAATWAGVFLLDAGVAAFVWRVYSLFRARVRRPLDPGMRFVRASLPFLVASAVMGPVLWALGITHTRLATAYVVTALLGGVMPFVIGILYRIVPLLTWTARFGTRTGRDPLPAAADLYSGGIARLQLAFHLAGVVVLLAGIAAASPPVARAGTVLFLGAIIILAFQLGRIRWGSPARRRSPRERA